MEEQRIINFEKFDSLIVKNDDFEEIANFVSQYLYEPRHLIFNFDYCQELSDENLDLLNFLATMLKSESYDLKLFNPSSNIINKLGTHRFRNLKQMSDLGEFLKGLATIEREYRVSSLLKSYIDNTLAVAFSKSKLVISRGELSLEDSPTSFINEMNYFQTFELEDAFFSFVIGGREDFFKEFIDRLGEKELAPILNTITDKISDELKASLKIHYYLSHPYKEFPTEVIKIENKTYNYFKNCGVMRIPMNCELGDFYVEVWIPKAFATIVHNFLNP